MNPPIAVLRLLALLACIAPGVRAGEPAAAPTTAPVPTVIESDTAEMVSGAKESTFSFRGHVVVTGTNLRVTCEQLVVIALRSGDPAAIIGKQEKFKSLVATGHVKILQSDREAACDRAEIFPQQDQVVLTGHLVIRALDNSFVQTGEKGTLYRDQRLAVIEGTATERTRITMPTLKDLGYDKALQKKPEQPKGDAEAGPKPAAPKSDEPPQIKVPDAAPPK